MEKRESPYLPKARTQELVFQSLDDEVLIYDMKRHKAHCLNRTAHLVFETCDGNNTVSEIKGMLTKQLGAPIPEEMVWMALDRLGKARLLEEGPVAATVTNLGRREALRKLGLATVVALPIVTSIIAPESVQAQSCLGSMAPCSAIMGAIPCCSPLTCQGAAGGMTCQ